MEVPRPTIETSPVTLFIVTTPVSEELKLNVPPLFELGAANMKFESFILLVWADNIPRVGLALATVRVSVALAAL